MTLPIFHSWTTQGNRQNKHSQQHKPSTQTKLLKSYATEQMKGCTCCKLTNLITCDCYRHQEKPKLEKEEFIQKNRLCFKCLEPSHRSKDCDKKLNCLRCKKGPATANHDPNFQYNKNLIEVTPTKLFLKLTHNLTNKSH